MAKKNGLQRCEEAFNRLMLGQPNLSDHVGVKSEDITPAMVSIEAGFDKGYLKRSRDYHLPLIARINATKTSAAPIASSAKDKLDRATRLAEKRSAELKELKLVMDKVLSQNLMLLERVRELEQEINKYQRKASF